MPDKYGIKLVWAGWTKFDGQEGLVGLSATKYPRYKDSIGVGTRMLVYETSTSGTRKPAIKGRTAIIAEIEVTEEFKLDNPDAPTKEHSYTVPFKVIRTEDETKPVPLPLIREIIQKSYFPSQNIPWEPLTDEEYRMLVASMKK